MADDVMNYKQLSEYLKLSEGGLRQKVMKGNIPSFRIDGAVRFSKKAIDEWIEGLHQKGKNKNQTLFAPEKKTDLFSANEEKNEKF